MSYSVNYKMSGPYPLDPSVIITTTITPRCEQPRMSPGTSLVVQWLGVHASTSGGMSLIPGLGNFPHAMQSGQYTMPPDTGRCLGGVVSDTCPRGEILTLGEFL